MGSPLSVASSITDIQTTFLTQIFSTASPRLRRVGARQLMSARNTWETRRASGKGGRPALPIPPSDDSRALLTELVEERHDLIQMTEVVLVPGLRR